MRFRLNELVRKLATALVAVAFVVATLGSGISTADATGSALYCASFANAQHENDVVQGHAPALGLKAAVVDQSGLDGPYQKSDGNAKSQCCSSFCSPAFFLFPDHNVDASMTVNNDDWPMSVPVLTSADTGNLKRPPRAPSSKFARA